MSSNRKTAIIVGASFLFVNVTFILGFFLLESTLNAPDYLIEVSANQTKVIIGVLLELINGIAYLGIAVLMFPILKQHNESIALGYVGFRIIEYIMQILSDISPLSLLSLSQEFVQAGAPDASHFQTLGALLLAERYWAFQMVSITFGIGALMFYYLLYQLKLIPRWLSGWGLIGAAVVLTNVMLDLFGYNPGNLGILMLLNELFLGVWLIIKGFNSSAINFPSTSNESTK